MGKLMADAAKKNGKTATRLKFWRVLKPFFTQENEARRKAWGWFALMIALLVLESGVLVAFSYTQVRGGLIRETDPPACGVCRRWGRAEGQHSLYITSDGCQESR